MDVLARQLYINIALRGASFFHFKYEGRAHICSAVCAHAAVDAANPKAFPVFERLFGVSSGAEISPYQYQPCRLQLMINS
jgi:hypothetical protein